MNLVLRKLCEVGLMIDCREHLLTSVQLSEATGIGRTKVLKELGILKRNGLVAYVRTFEKMPWDDEGAFIQGWTATRKAQGTPEYEAALDQETAWSIHFFAEDAEADPWRYARKFKSMRSAIDWGMKV